MQRSTYLAALSHDHHESLVIVSRITSALRSDEDLSELDRYMKEIWQKHLAPHFKVEEEVILPVLFEMNAYALGNRLLEEHKIIREAILSPRPGVNKQEHYAMLARLLREHIRFEERTVFLEIEQHASQETLEYIGARLMAEA